MPLDDMPLYRVFWRTRRLFQRLAADFQPAPGHAPLAPPQRAVLEVLARGDPQTVPEIARQWSVSRQHVQVSVNELLADGWVETRPNPAHRRSPLLALTGDGRARLEAAHLVEAEIIEAMTRHFSAHDLEVTARTLAALETFFDSATWASIRNG